MQQTQLGKQFVQQIDQAQLYFTHYALFEEPDPGVPSALYVDATTGKPTQELVLTAPVNHRVFTRQDPNPHALTAPRW